MTDPSQQSLQAMADEVAKLIGRFQRGRPAFSALSSAERALREAAQEVQHARRTYAPLTETARRGGPEEAAVIEGVWRRL
jgi:hypothetical protein